MPMQPNDRSSIHRPINTPFEPHRHPPTGPKQTCTSALQPWPRLLSVRTHLRHVAGAARPRLDGLDLHELHGLRVLLFIRWRGGKGREEVGVGWVSRGRCLVGWSFGSLAGPGNRHRHGHDGRRGGRSSGRVVGLALGGLHPLTHRSIHRSRSRSRRPFPLLSFPWPVPPNPRPHPSIGPSTPSRGVGRFHLP